MKCTDETNINKYGRIYRLWVLWEPLLCISSPQMAEVFHLLISHHFISE